MSRTWARKSYQDELDSVSQVGDDQRSSPGATRLGYGGIENRIIGLRSTGGGGRSAPTSVSVSDRGDLESQIQPLHPGLVKSRIIVES